MIPCSASTFHSRFTRALMIVGSQVTYILQFFLSRNICIARDRAWDQSVASRRDRTWQHASDVWWYLVMHVMVQVWKRPRTCKQTPLPSNFLNISANYNVINPPISSRDHWKQLPTQSAPSLKVPSPKAPSLGAPTGQGLLCLPSEHPSFGRPHNDKSVSSHHV